MSAIILNIRLLTVTYVNLDIIGFLEEFNIAAYYTLINLCSKIAAL